jgi:hypothetical protein
MKLLHDLGEAGAGPGGVSRSSFVAGAQRELSVGLYRGNFMAYLGPATGTWSRAVWLGVKAGYALLCRFIDCMDGIAITCR